MASEMTDLLASLLNDWYEDPVLGVEELFRVSPTDQQAQLIRAAWKPEARVAVSSCTGAGKTAALTWITFLALLTLPDCRIFITSPSSQQLTRVFYAEAVKWRGRMVHEEFKRMFEITRERIECKQRDQIQIANLVTSSAEALESLAGGHSENYIILADEASAIPEGAFDYLIGTLSTDTSEDQSGAGRFILTSNPTRSSGRFYEIFHKNLDGWDRLQFKAHDCPHISKKWIEEIINMYGDDSDMVRVRIMGTFPRAANTQFIGSDIVEAAEIIQYTDREVSNFSTVIGVDVARFGDDETVFVARKGPKIMDIKRYQKKDTQEIAALLYEYQGLWKATTIYIDAIGIGAGVFDRAKNLKLPVKEIIASHKSVRPMEYFNMRSQLWGEMKKWLENGGSIPVISDLKMQLVSMTYGYNKKMQIQMTTKKDLKNLGVASPDIADAVALTMAEEVFGGFASHRAGKRKVIPRPVPV